MKIFLLTKEIIKDKLISRLILVISAVISISLGAYIRIDLGFSPVPITLQTFFVFLFASLLNKGLATFSILTYIFLGISGLGIFAFPCRGINYLFGPTGGYLIGFILASLFIEINIASLKERKFLSLFLVMLGAELIILLIGSLWLKFFLNSTFKKAIILGFLPFIPFDLVKLYLAVKLSLKLYPRLKNIT